MEIQKDKPVDSHSGNNRRMPNHVLEDVSIGLVVLLKSSSKVKKHLNIICFSEMSVFIGTSYFSFLFFTKISVILNNVSIGVDGDSVDDILCDK